MCMPLIARKGWNLLMGQRIVPKTFRCGPDGMGHFGLYGGRYIAETLMPILLELEHSYNQAMADATFTAEMHSLLCHYVGRPSPLFFAARLTAHLGGAKIYLKREDLNHTGAHKINNCIGQCLLARRMGRRRIIAETGAAQHGVATATVCALFGMTCTIYMGIHDIERQEPNVFRMKLLGADVKPVGAGTGTLKDAINETLRDWLASVETTYYLMGTAAGPHPYPVMVRDFQSVIGNETRKQIVAQEGRLPDVLIACIGGGSNAIGLFHPFLDEEAVRLIGVEAAGHGLESDYHAASLIKGHVGVLHGNRTYLLQDSNGQITTAHSVAAGLTYPGVGPEHAWLKDSGRVSYVPITDEEAIQAFHLLTRLEGIIPALESSHAIGYAMKLAPSLSKNHIIVVNLSGRGDKDMAIVMKSLHLHQGGKE